ncbi:2-amino-4-hydroxy-6-hydroxymethyldihydropteridine diphosphokinase [Robiginitalea biformata]|uniref:2-amino-4-hydroxy-6- hydroxymethyldihydropteridine diphosphokinase n=1 Tax=Robiginitalea biformata TaxID=252307 RepID=UPI003B5A1E45
MEKSRETAYLSLGSNLGHRAWLLQQAVFRIGERAGRVSRISPVYESPSWGFEGGDFLNLCVEIQTSLSPVELLGTLLGIEKDLGRERDGTPGYTSRKVDIDILYYGNSTLSATMLEIPHPRIAERAFVLKPLADIAPQYYHPMLGKDTRNLLQACRDRSGVTRSGIKIFPDRASQFADLGYIAIEGNIGAGKTTLAGKIAEDMNAKLILERFADNPFLPKFYQDQARYAFPLEMSFLAERYQQFTEDTRQLDLFKRFMVSDYDIYKSLIFARITLQEDEFLLYRKLFTLMYQEVRKPRLYVYLYQHTDRLLRQIANRGRDYERGIPAEYLEKIHRGYFDFMRNSPELNTLVIDVSELDFVANPEDYEQVLNEMSARILREGDVKF